MQNSHIRPMPSPLFSLIKPRHFPHVTLSRGLRASFTLGPFFFEEHLSLFDWKTTTVTVVHYLTYLHVHVVSELQERNALTVVTFISDGAPPHIAYMKAKC